MYVEDNVYIEDDWPEMPDGSEFDGKQLLTLVRSGNSPFHKDWDINLLIQEVEENLGTEVIDIPVVSKGSNNYVSAHNPIQAILRRVSCRVSTSSCRIDQTS